MSDSPEKDEAAAPQPEPASGSEPKPEPEPEDKPEPDAVAKPEPDAGGSRKRKRRKKGSSAATSSAGERPELDAKGRLRPAFLLRFPEDPELDEVIRAFEAGNYARVRELGTRLADGTTRPDLRAAAEELVRRTEPDPLVKILLGLVAALFLAVVAYAYFSA